MTTLGTATSRSRGFATRGVDGTELCLLCHTLEPLVPHVLGSLRLLLLCKCMGTNLTVEGHSHVCTSDGASLCKVLGCEPNPIAKAIGYLTSRMEQCTKVFVDKVADEGRSIGTLVGILGVVVLLTTRVLPVGALLVHACRTSIEEVLALREANLAHRIAGLSCMVVRESAFCELVARPRLVNDEGVARHLIVSCVLDCGPHIALLHLSGSVGVFGHIPMLEIVLTSLNTDTIACSMLHLGDERGVQGDALKGATESIMLIGRFPVFQ